MQLALQQTHNALSSQLRLIWLAHLYNFPLIGSNRIYSAQLKILLSPIVMHALIALIDVTVQAIMLVVRNNYTVDPLHGLMTNY